MLACGSTAHAGESTLLRHAALPAETYASGPPAGQFADRGSYGERLAQARFARQPVQGISSIKPGPRPGTWWALSDNGFGTKWNSLDYRTCIYLFDEQLRLLRRIELRDPQRRFPYALILAGDASRPLTGGDIDPESMVVMPDGSFWIGDELGPWLLHFSASGNLLAAPFEAHSQDGSVLRSPNHPEVLQRRAVANLRASSGFEGLAMLGRGRARRLYALLEKPLPDEPDARDLQLLEFEPGRGRWTARRWRYRLDAPDHAVGEIASTPAGELLAIERDTRQGAAARTKMIYRVVSPGTQPSGELLAKKAWVDLLALGDPNHLGGTEPVLRFSYETIESLQVLDNHSVLVVNDNNFPSSGGRGGTAPDPTEWLWIRIPDLTR